MSSFFYLASPGLRIHEHLKFKKQGNFLHIVELFPYVISKGWDEISLSYSVFMISLSFWIFKICFYAITIVIFQNCKKEVHWPYSINEVEGETRYLKKSGHSDRIFPLP